MFVFSGVKPKLISSQEIFMNKNWFGGIFLKCWLHRRLSFSSASSGRRSSIVAHVSGAGWHQRKHFSQKYESIQWLFKEQTKLQTMRGHQTKHSSFFFPAVINFAFSAVSLSTRCNMSWPPNLLQRSAVCTPSPLQCLWKMIWTNEKSHKNCAERFEWINSENSWHQQIEQINPGSLGHMV